MNTRLKYIPVVLLTILIVQSFSPVVETDDTHKQITSALSSGDASRLSSFFNQMVDLSIAGNEDSYSKTQATRIIQDFFTKNQVKSYKMTRKGTSNDGSCFALGEMNAGGKTFRVYYLLKKVSGKFLIHQLQIQ
ncbi:MAG: DUF4783 domain-containing protein [Bacteroidota bacterium]|nr:DUF4783 domain-containing protein [Bacteroidota bacterium]